MAGILACFILELFTQGRALLDPIDPLMMVSLQPGEPACHSTVLARPTDSFVTVLQPHLNNPQHWPNSMIFASKHSKVQKDNSVHLSPIADKV